MSHGQRPIGRIVHRGASRAAPLLFAVLWLGVPRAAHAGGPGPDDAAADRVVAALQSKDSAALRDLAARDDPDPWVVTDVLLGRGNTDAARRFATAASRASTKGLAAALEADAKAARDDKPVRSALSIASAAIDEVDGARALAALEGAAPRDGTLLSARVRLARSRALQVARKFDESAKAADDAATAAAALGWLAGEAQARETAARSLYRRGALAGARASAEAWLAVERRIESSQGVARATWLLASVRVYAGELAPAEALAKEALALAKAAGDVEYEGHALGTLSTVAGARGDSAGAADLARQAIARLEAKSPPPSAARFRRDDRLAAQTAASLRLVLAASAAERGQGDEARRLVSEAIDIADRNGAPATSARALLLRGALLERSRDALGALAEYERALARAGDAKDQAVATAAQRRIGGARRALRDLPGAIEQLQAARDSAASLGQRGEAALIRIEIGRTLAEMGELPEALAAFEAARAEGAALSLRRVVASALEQEASVRTRQGRYADALTRFAEALAERRAVGPPSETASLLYAIGLAERRIGDAAKADERLREARTIASGVGDRAVAGRAATALAEAALDAGDVDDARTLVEAARLDLASARDPGGEAAALLVLAALDLAAGDAAKAADAAASAVALLDASGTSRRAALGRQRLAQCLAAAGRPADARAAVEAGVARARAASDPDALATCLHTLAALEASAGRWADAAARANEALDVLEPIGHDLSDEESAASRAPLSPVAQIGALACVKSGDAAGAFRFLEAGRAAALRGSLGTRDAIRRAVVPDALRAEESAARAQEALAVERARRASESGDLAEARRERVALEAATARVRDVVTRIQRSARAAAAAVYPRPFALDDAKTLLRPGDALVLYETSSEDAFALVVDANGARSVSLGPTKDLLAACERLLPEGEPPVDPDGVASARERLVKPLALGAAVRRVVVSPDGALAFVPFCLLIEARELVYAPSATVLSLLRADASTRGDGVLALGDPDYGTTGPSSATRGSDGRGRALAPLPATRAEAKAIGDVVLLGADASETRFVREVASRPRWRAVHLACHGLASAEGTGFASLALTADAENDGFLSALDVTGLRIGAELVVLSGCETVKGRLVGGEGVVGLPRAFLVAGASRVLASAWKVDDEATRALMERFYARWNPRPGHARPADSAAPQDDKPALSAPAALADAQAFVRSHPKWAHPRYWAAWSLWGVVD